MFHFGFSYVGLLFLIMLFAPNGIWTKNKPQNYDEYVKNENKLLLGMERIGEVLVSCLALIFSDFNVRNSYWAIWLVLAFLCMILYEIFWVRYFKSPKTMLDFYSSVCKVPVAGATLPVLAFFFLGIYGSNIFMIVASVFLGVGHIGIHLQHRKEALAENVSDDDEQADAESKKAKKSFVKRLFGGIGCFVLLLFLGVVIVVIAIRNISYVANHGKAVEEDTFVNLCGQEQRVIIRTDNADNPVIVYLHGGPASPDCYINYRFANYLIDDFTFISWDQRGCGRTYIKNAKLDPSNKTANYNQAMQDLDALVDYARNRFHKDKVIIMGWSYGSYLGTDYVSKHPEKVEAYVGVGQFVSLKKSDIYSYEDALAVANKNGDDVSEMTEAYDTFMRNQSLFNMMALRNIVMRYHPQEIVGDTSMAAVVSPYFTMDDFRWFIKQLGSFEEYSKLNHQLFDFIMKADVEENDTDFEVPMYYISGSCDWVCVASMAEEYVDTKVTAPKKEFVYIDGCGHGVQYDLPKTFAENVKRMLRNNK